MELTGYGALLGPPSSQQLILIFTRRIDKYYMLVRRFVNASFRLLIRTNWEEETCKMYNDILTSEKGPLWYVPTRTASVLTKLSIVQQIPVSLWAYLIISLIFTLRNSTELSLWLLNKSPHPSLLVPFSNLSSFWWLKLQPRQCINVFTQHC